METGIKINIEGDVLVVIQQLQQHFINLDTKVDKLESGVKDMGTAIQSSLGSMLVTGLNQTIEVLDKLSNSLEFTNQIKHLEDNVKRFTDLSGSELSKVTSEAYKMGEVFDENAESIIAAANSMTKQIGGSFKENLALIQQGFEKGANLNGDMIDQLKEYGPQIKQVGLETEEFIAIMATASKEGVYSDKAIDAIKEGGLSIREMGQTQIDALAGIGLTANDLLGKSTFEAMKMISTAMQSADDQAKQMALTDIFKGAGEDAGLGFIEGLATMDLSLDNLPSVKQSGEDMKSFFADVKFGLAQAVGDLTPYIQSFASIGQGMAGLSAVSQAYNVLKEKSLFLSAKTFIAQKAQAVWTTILTAKQWMLNVALNANPIGLVIAGVAALIALVATIIVYYDDWGASLTLLLGPFGMIINVIQSFRRHWDEVKAAFTDGGFLEGIKMIGLVILDAILMPVQQLLEILSKIPGLGGLAQSGADAIEGIRANLGLAPETEKEPSAEDYTNALYVDNTKKPVEDSVLPFVKKPKTPDTKTDTKADSGGAGKNITVSIQNLVKDLTVSTSNMKESPAKIKQMIAEALTGAVRDFETTI